ncbi:hypothetical protein [Alkalihalophilus marmarensis]|uniref:hypothetical protein n=1 Tax=Alkalihalophilus marmarensis TaxID=521377 RepID=UPI001379A252|nr:hypothetical protein [Alkalihalophilus marmarensis]
MKASHVQAKEFLLAMVVDFRCRYSLSAGGPGASSSFSLLWVSHGQRTSPGVSYLPLQSTELEEDYIFLHKKTTYLIQ